MVIWATNHLGDGCSSDKTFGRYFGRHHIYLVCPFIPISNRRWHTSLEKSRCRLVESCNWHALVMHCDQSTRLFKKSQKQTTRKFCSMSQSSKVPYEWSETVRILTTPRNHATPPIPCDGMSSKQCYAVQVLIITPVLCDDFSNGQWSKPINLYISHISRS